MIRSSVVLPEPDGPNSATSSPLATFRSTPFEATNARTSFDIPDFNRHRDVSPFVQMPFENGLRHQRDQGQHRQQ